MMGLEFLNDPLNLSGVDDSRYYYEYPETEYTGNDQEIFGNDIIELGEEYLNFLPEDQFSTFNNTTAIYPAETNESQNCAEEMDFLLEMNKYYSPSQFIVPTIYCVISLIGLVGNGLVMFVIFGSKEMAKTVANIYILNLAIADTLLLISLPFMSTQRILLSWPFGAGMCKIVEAVKFLNYFASVFFLTAMSIDRYIAVVYVVTSSKWRTGRNTFFICAAIWLVSFVMIVPLLIYTQVHGDMCALVFNSQQEFANFEKDMEESPYGWLGVDYNNFGEEDCEKVSYFDDYSNFESTDEVSESEMSGSFDFNSYMEEMDNNTGRHATDDIRVLCKHPNSKTFHAFLIFTFVVCFVIPFIIITACYIMIVVKLTRHSEARTRSKQAERTRRKVTRMVIALVIAFFICWLPFYLWHLIQIQGVKAKIGICHNIRDFTFCLGYANSCLNPLLYTFLGHNFHERLRKSIAFSLRSLSFSTFTRYTNTASRADTGAHSKKMEASHSENVDHHQQHPSSRSAPILNQVKEEDETSVNYCNKKLLEHG